MEMKTAVVILNWNTEGFLRDFLPGLLHSVSKIEGAEVIVADNASTDGSMEVMHNEFPEVKTLLFDRNLGFTGGYNRAFREISDRYGRPEYFLLINSDIEVTDRWLEPLVKWMDTHPECGACAPKLHSWQERDKFEYAGAAGGYIDRFGYPFCRGRILKRLETDNGQYDSPADVFWATGACLMVRYCLVYGGNDKVLERLNVIGINDLGVDLDRKDLLLAVNLNADNSAASLNIVFTRLKLRLHCSHILLHLLRLLKHGLHIGRASTHSLG